MTLTLVPKGGRGKRGLCFQLTELLKRGGGTLTPLVAEQEESIDGSRSEPKKGEKAIQAGERRAVQRGEGTYRFLPKYEGGVCGQQTVRVMFTWCTGAGGRTGLKSYFSLEA